MKVDSHNRDPKDQQQASPLHEASATEELTQEAPGVAPPPFRLESSEEPQNQENETEETLQEGEQEGRTSVAPPEAPVAPLNPPDAPEANADAENGPENANSFSAEGPNGAPVNPMINGGNSAPFSPDTSNATSLNPQASQKSSSLQAADISGNDSSAVLGKLSSLPSTQMVASFPKTGQAISQSKAQEKDQAQQGLPTVMQPTGLNAKPGPKLKPQRGPNAAKEIKEFTIQAKGANAPTQGNNTNFSPGSGEQVNTTAGTPPKVQLGGETDPSQNQQAKTQADAQVNQESQQADTATSQDFGENEMYPSVQPEMLSSQKQLSSPSSWNSSVSKMPKLDPQVIGPLDAQLPKKANPEMAPHLSKETEAKGNFETQSAQEKLSGEEKIAAETEKVRAEQLGLQSKGKADVQKQRELWMSENADVKRQYDSQSASKKEEIDAQINQKVSETNTQVQAKFTEAENKAAAEKSKAEGDAQKERDKGKKKKKKGLWGRIKSAVKGLFDKIKKAVSKIFDAVRSLVKTIIETAKKAASALIDLAKNAIKSIIKGFATVLKGLIQVALAAFPKIADRFCALIDQAVDATLKAIDTLAEGLKSAVNFILDTIGSAIDAYLAAYQKVLDWVLSAIEFVVVGLLLIMEGIANLVIAASKMGGFFGGAVSEELLGQDVTKALPNEYAASEMAAPVALQSSDQSAIPTGGGSGSPDAASALLGKNSYQESDFQVPVLSGAQLDPALLQALGQGGDKVVEFGEQTGEGHGIDALKEEVGGGPTTEGTATAHENQPESPAPASSAAMDPQRDRFSPDAMGMVGPFSAGERAKFTLSQMGKAMKDWFSANWGKILAAVIGGITGLILANIVTGGAVMAALPLLMQLVSAYFGAEAIIRMGIYFGKYLGTAWPGQIAKGAGNFARAVAIGASELAFALLFGGKGVIKGAKNVAKTAAKGGAKGLAKSGAKAVKNTVKTTAKSAKDLAKVGINGVKNTGRNVVKGGKFLMGGLKRGAIAGSKNLKDLGKKLGKIFKFRKFKIVVKGKRFRLFGKMNPWVLLADGQVEWFEQNHFKNSKAAKNGDDVEFITSTNPRPSRGTKRKRNGSSESNGIVIGEQRLSTDPLTGSRFVEGYRGAADDAKELYDELLPLDHADRLKMIKNQEDKLEALYKFSDKIGDTAKNRGKISSNIGAKPASSTRLPGKTADDFADWNAHHKIPVEALEKSAVLREAVENGFDFNGKANGKWVRQYSSEIKLNKAGQIKASPEGIHASHNTYNKSIIDRLAMIEAAKPANAKAAMEAFSKEIDDAIEALIKRNDDIITKALAKGDKIEDILPTLEKINDLKF